MPLWIIATQWLSRLVLLVLLFLSVWSVATMIQTSRRLKAASGENPAASSDQQKVSAWIDKKQWRDLQAWSETGTTLQAGTARILLEAKGQEPSKVDRAVRSYLTYQRTQLEEGMTVLATLGSNAPFIGLFGTVLGIIQAFGAMGAHQNSTADIMVGISEALVATAIGLFVAIPAVVAFNVFTRRLRVLIVSAEALRDGFLARSQEG